VDEMDASLIQNWNATVQHDDEIYILGDFCMNKDPVKAHNIVTRLHGKKYFIRGNHDLFLNKYEQFESDFVWIKDYAEVTLEKRRFVLFHYPIAEWNGYYRESIHCHGHVHSHAIAQDKSSNGAIEMAGRVVNVGVDVNGYRPVSIHEVIRMADKNKSLIM
jgi:calcineurin-like phosphoesterase family protein